MKREHEELENYWKRVLDPEGSIYQDQSMSSHRIYHPFLDRRPSVGRYDAVVHWIERSVLQEDDTRMIRVQMIVSYAFWEV